MTNISVDLLSFFENWSVDEDNVRFFDSIARTKGSVLTLDATPYVYWLDTFDVKYVVN